MITLKLMLFGWPLTYIALMYLPIRYGLAFGWVSLFIYLSDFGKKFVLAVYRLLAFKMEEWKINKDSSM